MKQVLILGGTQFVGRHLVERLKKSTDTELAITLFHRGQSNPDLFPELRHILGDRHSSDIQALCQQDWDVVIDFSCFYPRPFQTLLQSLKGQVGRYILVSTVSVYDLEAQAPESGKQREPEQQLINELSPTLECQPEDEIDQSPASYGKRKRACEQLLENVGIDEHLIFRPGLIYGPYDPTDRAYYWLWRVQQTRPFFVVNPEVQQQWTYASDFAQLLEMAALGPKRKNTMYLALSHEPMSWHEILKTMAQACQQSLQTLPVGGAWMEKEKLRYWQDIPLSLPFERPFDRSRCLQDFDLKTNSYLQSWQDTASYYASLNWPAPKTGISAEQEAQLIQKYSHPTE